MTHIQNEQATIVWVTDIFGFTQVTRELSIAQVLDARFKKENIQEYNWEEEHCAKYLMCEINSTLNEYRHILPF